MGFDLVIATRNKGKIREIKELLNNLDVNLTCIEDYPEMPEVIEDGDSLEANAKKKAIAVTKWTGKIVLADDSGLEVDYLDGVPGINSARFGDSAEKKLTDSQRNQKLLKLLAGVPIDKRTARFRTSIAIAQVASPNEEIIVVEGKCEGIISLEAKGESGFGYDPVFIPLGYDNTFAELGLDVKNKLSHRYIALCKAIEILSLIYPKSS